MALFDFSRAILKAEPRATMGEWRGAVEEFQVNLMASAAYFGPGVPHGTLDLIVASFALACLPEEPDAAVEATKAMANREDKDHMLEYGHIWGRLTLSTNKVVAAALRMQDLNEQEAALADMMKHMLLDYFAMVRDMLTEVGQPAEAQLLHFNEGLTFGQLSLEWYGRLNQWKTTRKDEFERLKDAMLLLPSFSKVIKLVQQVDAIVRVGTDGIGRIAEDADMDVYHAVTQMATMPVVRFTTMLGIESVNDVIHDMLEHWPGWVDRVVDRFAVAGTHFGKLPDEEENRRIMTATMTKSVLVDFLVVAYTTLDGAAVGRFAIAELPLRAHAFACIFQAILTPGSFLTTLFDQAREDPEAYQYEQGNGYVVTSMMEHLIVSMFQPKTTLPNFAINHTYVMRAIGRIIKMSYTRWLKGEEPGSCPFLRSPECMTYLAEIERQYSDSVNELADLFGEMKPAASGGATGKGKKKQKQIQKQPQPQAAEEGGGAAAQPQPQPPPPPPAPEINAELVYHDGHPRCRQMTVAAMRRFLVEECLRYEMAPRWKLTYRVSGLACRQRLMALKNNIHRTIVRQLTDGDVTAADVVGFIGAGDNPQDVQRRRLFLFQILCDIVMFAREHCGMAQLMTIDATHAHFLYHLLRWGGLEHGAAAPQANRIMTVRVNGRVVHLLVRDNDRRRTSDCDDLSKAYEDFQKTYLPEALGRFGYRGGNLVQFLRETVPPDADAPGGQALRRRIRQMVSMRMDFYQHLCTTVRVNRVFLHHEMYDLALAIAQALAAP